MASLPPARAFNGARELSGVPIGGARIWQSKPCAAEATVLRAPSTTRRFREAALPLLNDVYTLAHYLMRNPDDAEDAVQECYLRGLRYFDSYRGPAMKPWLLAILKNFCNSEFTRRGKQESLTEYSDDGSVGEQMAAWQEPQASLESAHSGSARMRSPVALVWEMKLLSRDKHVMPWRIEDELKKLGANYMQAGLWRGFAIRDGKPPTFWFAQSANS